MWLTKMSSNLPKECQDGTCYYWICGIPCNNEPTNEENVEDRDDFGDEGDFEE